MQALDRARGALYGLAIGDALGMPAEMLSRAEVLGLTELADSLYALRQP